MNWKKRGLVAVIVDAALLATTEGVTSMFPDAAPWVWFAASGVLLASAVWVLTPEIKSAWRLHRTEDWKREHPRLAGILNVAEAAGLVLLGIFIAPWLFVPLIGAIWLSIFLFALVWTGFDVDAALSVTNSGFSSGQK